jgi:hypothetical protein
VYFRNSLCLGCQAPLGYEPALQPVCALVPVENLGTWKLDAETAPDTMHFIQMIVKDTRGGQALI